MDFDLFTFILDNLEAAGVIGAYVSISIITVALLIFSSRGKMANKDQVGPKWAQPIIGGLFGVIPGCGGTIVAASMYKNKKLSFGGLLAAFITTLGEGSFVLLGASAEADVASNLTAFAIVNAVSLSIGIILGYVTDSIGYEISPSKIKKNITKEDEDYIYNGNPIAKNFIEKIGFYIILAISLFLFPGSIMALWGGGIAAIEDITVWVAIALTVFSIIYYLVCKLFYYEHDCSYREDLRSTLLHAVLDITMVTVFVFVGLFIANFIIDIIVGPEAFDAWMNSSAFAVVLIAALIGFTPGCGGMIAVAAAYITIPNFPIAALIAAAIATSGDGIFPLLAENKKDAIIISLASLSIALIVGLITLVI